MSAAQHDLDVAISVVSHADSSLLRRCLSTLPDACEGVNWRATAIENLPRPGPPLESEFPWLDVVRNPKALGFAQNHNAAIGPIISSRSARYVLVLNDDTELQPRAVTALVKFADEHPRAGGVGPRIFWPDGRSQLSFLSFPSLPRTVAAAFFPNVAACVSIGEGMGEGMGEGPGEGPGWLGGACLMLRADALREVGLFDERFFMFYEDTDLAMRLLEAGWELSQCSAASVVHRGHETVRQPAVRVAMECQVLRSRYLYFKKHRGVLASQLVMVATRCGLALRTILTLVRNDSSQRVPPRLLMRLVAYSPGSPLSHEVQAGAPASD